MSAKNNGVYYTPKALSEFMVKHALQGLPEGQALSILEPSCGDGVFIDAISSNLDIAQKQLHSLQCIEIDDQALELAKAKSCASFKEAFFSKEDFLDFITFEKKPYDLIIGNPPYVVRKRLPEKTVQKCKEVYQSAGLCDTYFRNLWGAFLVGSVKLLSKTGVLAYVLPAELLQVKFSEEIRNKLLKDFERVEIIVFKNIVFEGIEQDTIVLFCYKKHAEKGLFFDEKKDIDDLVSGALSFKSKNLKTIKTIKWTSHVLTEHELDLLASLKNRFSPISHYCTAVAGIVTAANNYFIVDDETVDEYELEEFVAPIIQRGLYINGSAVFTSGSLEYLRKNGKPCNLLNFNGHDASSFSKKVRKYLSLGEVQKIHERYKCQKRSPWYSIPGIWQSEGFFFKRSHLYPKLLENQAGAMVTDSAYRIKMLEGNCIKSLVYSFYNSLSLSLAELEGRFYGGGVLELTPNEFKSISIPYLKVSEDDYSSFINQFQTKKTIADISHKVDRTILQDHFGLDDATITTLQEIKDKLSARRLGKTQNAAA